jgi:hypothetical protein
MASSSCCGSSGVVLLTPAALKNPILAILFSSQDFLAQLLSTSLVTFAPGLLDRLKATSPPTITFFKSLPTRLKKHWAVYVLVLEKRSYRPKIYVGSGTHAVSGIWERFNQYDNNTNIPMYVKRALDDGYSIVHKGLLCWCPLPSAVTRIPLRALFLVLETVSTQLPCRGPRSVHKSGPPVCITFVLTQQVFALVLWAMYSRTKDYDMPHLCPWSLDLFEYDGLCSHCSIKERVSNEASGLTVEQLEAKEVKMDKRRKEALKAQQAKVPPEKKKQYAKTAKANTIARRTYACEICDLVFIQTSDLELHKTTKKHIDKVAGTTYTVPDRDCEDCHEKFPTVTQLARHKLTSKHLKKVAGVSNNKYPGGPRCVICDMTFEKQSKLAKHNLTKRHIKKAAAATVNKASGVNRVLKFPGAAASERAEAAANIAARKHHCRICDHSFANKAQLGVHNASKKHKDKAAAAAESESS